MNAEKKREGRASVQVRELAREFTSDAVRINVGGTEELVANANITQHVQMHLNTETRLRAVSELVAGMEQRMKEEGRGNAHSSKVCHTCVFVNRKVDANMVADRIERENDSREEMEELVRRRLAAVKAVQEGASKDAPH